MGTIVASQNWYERQLLNKNYLSPIGFRLTVEKTPKVSFLCQSVSIPNITLGSVEVPTGPYVNYPVSANVSYGDFRVQFLVDENIENFLEIHDWMRALGTPSDYNERTQWLKDQPREKTRFNFTNLEHTSDATLIVLNNNMKANFKIVFKDMFPVELTPLEFDVSGSDNDFFKAEATFRYTLYEIRKETDY